MPRCICGRNIIQTYSSCKREPLRVNPPKAAAHHNRERTTEKMPITLLYTFLKKSQEVSRIFWQNHRKKVHSYSIMHKAKVKLCVNIAVGNDSNACIF